MYIYMYIYMYMYMYSVHAYLYLYLYELSVSNSICHINHNRWLLATLQVFVHVHMHVNVRCTLYMYIHDVLVWRIVFVHVGPSGHSCGEICCRLKWNCASASVLCINQQSANSFLPSLNSSYREHVALEHVALEHIANGLTSWAGMEIYWQ